MFTTTCKRSDQIFKGHITHTMPIYLSFLPVFFWNYIVLLFVFLTLLLFKFLFHYLFLHFSTKYLENINWEVLPLNKFGKLCSVVKIKIFYITSFL